MRNKPKERGGRIYLDFLVFFEFIIYVATAFCLLILILDKYIMVEISVNQNLEKAMRVLKRKLIREGIFKELKARRFYEKPCEKRIRKEKESFKKKKRENCVSCLTIPLKKV